MEHAQQNESIREPQEPDQSGKTGLEHANLRHLASKTDHVWL